MCRIRRCLSAFLALVLCLTVLGPTAVPVSALSTGYQDFVLWAPSGTKTGGWLEYAQTSGNNANIYPRNATTPYFDTSAYIENKDRELYIRPGSYTMELTEAGKLSYGSGWDITVSNGKNYKYVNLVGNASVQKVEYQYGTAGSKWTRVRFGNLKLGDVIRVEAYQQNHWLKVGDPRVRIFADGDDVTGRTTAVDSGTSMPISATGYIDATTPRDGNLTLHASNGAKIEDGMITFTGGGTASVTATWKSYDGYFKAQSTSYFTVRDLSKVVKAIEVEGQETQYERLEGFKDQGTIVAHMMDGVTTERIDLVRKYVTGFDSSTAGDRTLTVAYGGCTTTYDIDVRWRPAGIQVMLDDASGYGQVKTGTIELSGDVDHVTLPDGQEVAPADLDSRYTFTENGTFEFAATGKGGDVDSDTVVISGIDKEPPELNYELADGKVELKSWDVSPGLKSVSYFGLKSDWAHVNQHTSMPGAWTEDYDLDGVAGGVYRVVATDYAGNSASVDIPVNVEAAPETKPDFKIYVPARVTMGIDKTGAVTLSPEANWIYNGVETEAIRVKGVTVDVADGWTLEDPDSDFSGFEKDSNRIGLTVNGTKVNNDGTVDIEPEEWIIPADERMELVLDAKASARTESLVSANVLKLNFTADWYEDGESLTGEKHVMKIVDVANATIANGMVQVETDEYGKIVLLPRVTVDDARYFTFEGWVDAGTGAAVNVGDVLTDDIDIRPVVSGELPAIKGTVTGTLTDPAIAVSDSTWLDIDWEGCVPDQGIKEIRTTANLSAEVDPTIRIKDLDASFKDLVGLDTMNGQKAVFNYMSYYWDDDDVEFDIYGVPATYDESGRFSFDPYTFTVRDPSIKDVIDTLNNYVASKFVVPMVDGGGFGVKNGILVFNKPIERVPRYKYEAWSYAARSGDTVLSAYRSMLENGTACSSTLSEVSTATTVDDYLGKQGSGAHVDLTVLYSGSSIPVAFDVSGTATFGDVISKIKGELAEWGVTSTSVIVENDRIVIKDMAGNSVAYRTNAADTLMRAGYPGQTSSGRQQVIIRGLYAGSGKVTIVMQDGREIEKTVLVRS